MVEPLKLLLIGFAIFDEVKDYMSILAQQEITWKFNVSKAAWWGAIYERLIKGIKGMIHKTLGRTHLSFA